MHEFTDSAKELTALIIALLTALGGTLTVMLKPWEYRRAVRERRDTELEQARLDAVREREAETRRIENAITRSVKPIHSVVTKISTEQDDISERVSKIEGHLGL